MANRLLVVFGLVLLVLAAALALVEINNSTEDSSQDDPSVIHLRTVSDHTESRDFRAVNNPVEPVYQWPAQAPTATPVPVEYINQARAAEEVLVNIYERVNRSVVNIEVVDRGSRSDFIDSSGSGFVLDREGHIATNAHVVIDAREILVTFSDGFVASAEIIGVDEYSDLAVIKVDVDPERLIPVIIGDSSEVRIGQSIVAIGNPFGLRSSMTTGIISATGRTLESQALINPSTQDVYNNPAIIQIDADVNPGNSGGPILDLEGRVIGIATAIRSDSGIFEGVAYAVPSNTLSRIAPQLIERGFAEYPWLGIRTIDHSQPGLSMGALSVELGLPAQNGVLIQDVLDDSPAEEAGLRGGDTNVTVRGIPIRVGGDIIVAINGLFIADLDELLEYLVQNHAPGDVVTLTIVRGDETLDLDVELGIRPN
ncbi:MAG: PDZ domain-containing protein [Chloroflexi bacterium]|nr:PDZ domain-containing protein [Chloroflexota bacterium]